MARFASPRYAVTEHALHLLLHAHVGITADTINWIRPHGRINFNPFGKSTLPNHWLPEVALLRIISVTEAYVDAISMQRMNALVVGTDRIARMLLSDFEISSTSSWDERHSAFERYHGFGLRSEPQWQQLAAGIEVRNCLAHGLGNLTARQRAKTGIGQKLAIIDVTVASNQMHLSKRTIPKLGEASMAFVRAIDGKITLS